MKVSIFLLLVSISFSALAKNIAKVKLLRGKVFISSPSKAKTQLKKGDWVDEGDVIQTQKRSFARLGFIDDSKVNIGPNSEVKVEQFSDDKPGVLSVVTGKIRAEVSKDYLKMKKNKSKLFVKSNDAVMGIRGTDFLFSTSKKSKKTTAVLFRGSVVFNNLPRKDRSNFKKFESIVSRGVQLRPGEFSVATRRQRAPTAPRKLNAGQFLKLQKNKKLDHSSTARSVVPAGLTQDIVKTETPAPSSSARVGSSGTSPDSSARTASSDSSARLAAPDSLDQAPIIELESGAILDANNLKDGHISSTGEFIINADKKISTDGQILSAREMTTNETNRESLEQIPLPTGVNYQPPSFNNTDPTVAPPPPTGKRRVNINIDSAGSP